jgi:predicted translin family RNA/ssDNA-binding protein
MCSVAPPGGAIFAVGVYPVTWGCLNADLDEFEHVYLVSLCHHHYMEVVNVILIMRVNQYVPSYVSTTYNVTKTDYIII